MLRSRPTTPPPPKALKLFMTVPSLTSYTPAREILGTPEDSEEVA